MCINTSRHFGQFVQSVEPRRPLSPARRDLSITQSLAAASAHLGLPVPFPKHGEGCDEESRGVNGVVRAKYLEMRGRRGEGGMMKIGAGADLQATGEELQRAEGEGEGEEIKQGGESENRRQK